MRKRIISARIYENGCSDTAPAPGRVNGAEGEHGALERARRRQRLVALRAPRGLPASPEEEARRGGAARQSRGREYM